MRAWAAAIAAKYAATLPEGDAGLIEAERRDPELSSTRYALVDEFGSPEAERIVEDTIEGPESRLSDFIEETGPARLAGAAAKASIYEAVGSVQR